ncbi:hypothetical protein MYFR107205_15520 [Mycolicibacterium frederiksbergense]
MTPLTISADMGEHIADQTPPTLDGNALYGSIPADVDQTPVRIRIGFRPEFGAILDNDAGVRARRNPACANSRVDQPVSAGAKHDFTRAVIKNRLNHLAVVDAVRGRNGANAPKRTVCVAWIS